MATSNTLDHHTNPKLLDKEQSVQHYWTTDLTQFSHHPLNRNIVPSHVRQLADSMKKHGFKAEYAILVNELEPGKLTVISGHHRLEAAKLSKAGVWYAYCDYNEPQRDKVLRWNNRDIIRFYARKGLVYYKHIEDWLEASGLPISCLYRLIPFYDKASRRTALDSGKLTLTSAERQLMERTLLLVQRIREALKLSPRKNYHMFFSSLMVLIRAQLIDLIDHDPLVQKLSTRYALDKFAKNRITNLDDGVRFIDQVWNYRAVEPRFMFQHYQIHLTKERYAQR